MLQGRDGKPPKIVTVDTDAEVIALYYLLIHMILLIRRVLCFYNQTNKYNLRIN